MYLPLNHCSRILNLDEFVLFVIEEIKREAVFQGVVGKEDAIEVVLLMEEDPGGETGECFCNLYTVLIDCSDFNFFGSGDGAVEMRDTETSFEGGAFWGATEGSFFTLI